MEITYKLIDKRDEYDIYFPNKYHKILINFSDFTRGPLKLYIEKSHFKTIQEFIENMNIIINNSYNIVSICSAKYIMFGIQGENYSYSIEIGEYYRIRNNNERRGCEYTTTNFNEFMEEMSKYPFYKQDDIKIAIKD